MSSHISSSSGLLSSLLAAFLILIEITSSSLASELYSSCSKLLNCGNITDVGYPFWGGSRASGCGYPDLELSCENNTTAKVVIANVNYQVLGVYPQTQVLKIARQDYSNGLCSPEFINTTLDPALYDLAPGYTNFTFIYGCPPNGIVNIPGKFSCTIDGIAFKDGYTLPGARGPAACFSSVVIPVSQALLADIGNSSNSLTKILQEGFEIRLKVDDAACGDCTGSKGVCGYDSSVNQTMCYCANQSSGSRTCSSSSAAGNQGNKNQIPLGLGLAFAGAGITGLLLGFWIFSLRSKKRRKREAAGAAAAAAAGQSESKDISGPPSSKGILPISTTSYSRTTPSYPSSKSDLEKGSMYFGVQVFSYLELEEATHNFDPARELGDGGFGTVYYGELQDGRVVAVKRLYENNMKRVEQFMNEVEILTRLRHDNLVTLFGCTSRRSRELLLVYEFIPNGTVADHLHGKRAGSGLVPWRIRLNIAIETADALAYLHESDVIHRDVKTNNILLDNNFRVKVADFGLSRLFPNDVTHVSTAPQGTPGYVDPEYYQCYQLTDKSDVYSFGVVLCELLSSKPAVDTNRHRHDINLANMAVNKIQNHTLHELVDPSLGFETDYSVRRMATLVAELAFRCLQQERDMRPTMLEVLEALRRIKNEENSFQSTEVVEMDIRSDDAGFLKNNIAPPPFSPESVVTDKGVSNSNVPNSF